MRSELCCLETYAGAINFIFALGCSCLPAWWCKQNGSRDCRSSIWMPGINLRDDTQATDDPMAQPVLGVFYWLPWVLLPHESWFWVVPRHSMAWLYLFPYKRLRRSTSEISKGNVLVTIITSLPWDMERVLRSWPCYELRSSVDSFEEIWDAAAKRP